MSVQPTTDAPSRRRFTVDEYHRMAESGILSEEDRIELIDGEIIEMVPIGSRHAGHLKHLNRLLSSAIGDDGIMSIQDPIHLGRHSEPQPDLAVLKPRDDVYTGAHPTPDDILLVVEIADTSLEFDRTTKIPLYARHGVPVTWLLNLQNETVEVHERPDADGYRITHSLRDDAVVEHPDLGLEFEARQLFVS